jgi:dienelactone hydrolase
VLTPVVDLLVARDDVDADRIALYGVSQAGYWVPRALAFEQRFAAAIVDGGVLDVARSWSQHIPHLLLATYEKGAKKRFDREMAVAMRLSTGARRTWDFRARPYGVSGYSAVLDAVSCYTVEDVAEKITTPLLITEPDGEQFFPGQSAELAALVPDATLVRFTQEEGASYHCQPLARELTEQRMFDWLDERIR